MKLRRVSVKNVRNHESFTCDFSNTTTLVYGKNGAGKTAILEAIAIAYRGTSFRGTDKDIVRNDQRWYRIDVEDDSGITRRIVYDARGDRPLKQFIVDEKKYGRLPQKDKYPIVLFTPDDLRMIDGSPARRRKYLDDVISQYDPQYAAMRRRYERALLQRNKLLKQPDVTPEQLFSWNVILAESGAYMINARIEYTGYVDRRLTGYYRQISQSEDVLSMQYSENKVSSQILLREYEKSIQRDLLATSTSVGPHRHDIVFFLNSQDTSRTASRGELRTIVVALKFIEAQLLEEKSSYTPLIILDDVFGELDQHRQLNLLEYFKNNQVVITSADELSGAKSRKKVKIS